jgi:hypothetical protein
VVHRVLIVGALATVLGACGGDHERRAPRAHATVFPLALQTANCDQWREMRPPSQRALVEQMRTFFGANVSDEFGRGQTLSTERAFEVLTNGCRPAYAGAVKLYKLYGRAAAFTP